MITANKLTSQDRFEREGTLELIYIEEQVLRADAQWNNSIVIQCENEYVIKELINSGYKVTRGDNRMPTLIKIEWIHERTINPFE